MDAKHRRSTPARRSLLGKNNNALSTSAQRFEKLYSHSIEGERLLQVITQLVEPIGRSLPSSSEVALHDLSLLPNSIVAI